MNKHIGWIKKQENWWRYSRDNKGLLNMSRKEWGKKLSNIDDYVDATIQGSEEYLKKRQ